MASTQLIHEIERAAALLAMMGNAKRLRIMCHLLAGELSVGRIAERVQLSQSALSQHLAKLRALDLVATRRDRQTIYYSLKSREAREMVMAVERIFGPAETATVTVLRRRQ